MFGARAGNLKTAVNALVTLLRPGAVWRGECVGYRWAS